MSRTHKKLLFISKLYWTLSHLASAIAVRIWIFGFASLLYRNYEFWIGWKICPITAGIKKHKSIIKKKEKNRAKLVLLEKSKLNGIEVLTSML